MLFSKRFKVLRVGPIQVYVDLLWFFTFLFFSYIVSGFYAPQLKSGPSFLPYVLGTVTVFFLFVCVLIHELSHSFTAIKNGIPVKQITLIVIGAVAQIEKNPETAGQEFKIAVAGPLSNFIIAGLLYGLINLCAWQGMTSAPFFLVVNQLITINIVLGIFNLLPAFPMDGGRVLRAVLWYCNKDQIVSTKIAVWAGRGFALLMIIGSIMLGSVWLIIIPIFIFSAGSSELRSLITRKKLKDNKVSELMEPATDRGVEVWKNVYKGKVIFCQSDAPVVEVLKLMRVHRTSKIFVKAGDAIVGSISISNIEMFLDGK